MRCIASDLAIAHWKGKLLFLIADTVLVPLLVIYATVVIIDAKIRRTCWVKGGMSDEVDLWI